MNFPSGFSVEYEFPYDNFKQSQFKLVIWGDFKLANPKLKSKVQVEVQADDWVLIKIGFSNHPASHPQESFKEAK